MHVSEYTMSPPQQLATEVGLRRPRKGSLGAGFFIVLLVGAMVGWVIGSRSVQPASAAGTAMACAPTRLARPRVSR